MKKILVLVLLAFSFSCKKDNEINTLKNEMIGTWELERISGYPFNQPTLPQGNGHIIVLGEGGLFERKQHDTLVFRGSYSVQRKKDCHERKTDITFSTNESSFGDYQYVEIAEGKLLLSTPNCYQDGGIAFYRRLH